ncbi:class I adenylate-forming enzyme family protein [Streptomyces hainanensis]|uniref:Long-chain fatty acid--CoA ligase n=1 Tax=Streptomyces hainanensis TaxID=402648 RepID=A0A4R4TMG3_9ACTN|nr:long-chain fatty acid--CoA ligase [Streptomyces hainanensis]TDC79221.1 long-chain fatty acid--CoA ligase [Streptomyces hainanensis]
MGVESVFAAVRDSTARWPEATALISPDRAWSRGDLLAAAERFAERLAAGRSHPRRVVAELTDPAATAVVTLGCDLAGISVVHRDPDLARPMADTSRAHGASDLLFHDGGTRPPGPRDVLWSEALTLWGGPPEGDPPADRVRPAAPAGRTGPPATAAVPPGSQIFLTSGSTGTPTGVVRTAVSVLADARRVGEFLGYGPDRPVVSAAPLFHAYGFNYGLIAPLLFGAVVRCCPSRSVPSQLARAVAETGAHTLIALPLHYGLLSVPDEGGRRGNGSGAPSAGPAGLAGLRQAVSAGAPLAAGTAARITRRFGFRFYDCYGSSEVGAVSLTRLVGDESADDVAIPLPGVDTRVEEGELLLRSSSLAAGRTTFDGATMTPLAGDDGWYRTGDLAGLAGDTPGGFRLMGRLGSLINVAGKKVSPAEVERVLAAHPAVAEVQVVGAADAARGQVPVARVVLRDSTPTAELIGWCRDRLTPHQVPRGIHLVAELPRSAAGKPVADPARDGSG